MRTHYDIIRKHAQETDESVYSAGWLLDIARCIYTLETMEVIAKTKAGEWALARSLCPDPDIMQRALEIRNEPIPYRNNAEQKLWATELGPYVQWFADVLEKRLSAMT